MQIKWSAILRKLAGFCLLALLVVSVLGYYQQQDMPREQAPLLVGRSLDGSLLDLQQMVAGGPVLIYFWATWCGYCRVVSPVIADLAHEHQVVSVAMQSGSHAEVAEYLASQSLQFPTINDPSAALSGSWGVRVTPTIVIVGSDGEVSWVTSGVTSKLGLQLRLALTE